MGPFVHEVSNPSEVTLGDKPALRDDEYLGSEPLDLVEHVARHDDASPGIAKRGDQFDHVQALARVEAGERFVEQQHVRVVHNRLRDLDPLAHPLRVRRHGARVVGVHLDQVEGATGRSPAVGDALQCRSEGDEIDRSLVGEQRLLLRDEADLTTGRTVGARVLAKHLDAAFRRRRQAGDHPQHRALSSPVRAEQCRHARADGERHLADRNDVAKPLTDIVNQQ